MSAAAIEVLRHALVFREPPAAGGVVVIAYAKDYPGSKRDARAIAAEIGPGLATPRGVLRPLVREVSTLADARFAVVIPAIGAAGPALERAWLGARALCATSDIRSVERGFCVLGVRASPRVEIVLNERAARKAHIQFATAFLMMITEK